MATAHHLLAEDTNIPAAPAIEGLLFLLQTLVRLLLLKQQAKQDCEYVLQELLSFGAGVKALAKLKSGIALFSKRSCHKEQTRTCHDAGREHKRPKALYGMKSVSF
jgi:hypothetical protein